MNYTRTFVRCGYVVNDERFGILYRRSHPEMYGYNSLHPLLTPQRAITWKCTGIIHYTLSPTCNVPHSHRYFISPARMATLSRFSMGASGQTQASL